MRKHMDNLYGSDEEKDRVLNVLGSHGALGRKRHGIG